MKKGEFVKARTNAEFLNRLIGTNYKAWMKCGYRINGDPDNILWFISFDGIKNKAGFCNYYDGEIIVEEYWVEDLVHDNADFFEASYQTRVAFDKQKSSFGYVYKFLGVFVFDKAKSKHGKHIWKRVSDEYKF